MPLGDIFEATFIGAHLSEETNNVFHFVATHVNTNATDLALRLNNQWIPQLEPLLAEDFFFDSIAVRNIFNPDDISLFPVGEFGDIVGDIMPPHDVMSIRFGTDRASLRNARKSFSGLVEGSHQFGEWLPATQANWQAVIDDYFTQPLLGTGGALLYDYIVIRRIKYTTSGGNEAYRLPILPTELDYATIISGVPVATVRTQKSRDFLE